MEHLLLFFLASAGMTSIIVKGAIFRPVREWLDGEKRLTFVSDLVHCVQCTGFWCGLFLGLFFVFNESAWMLLCYGFAGSFSAMLGDVLFETLYFFKEYIARRK